MGLYVKVSYISSANCNFLTVISISAQVDFEISQISKLPLK